VGSCQSYLLCFTVYLCIITGPCCVQSRIFLRTSHALEKMVSFSKPEKEVTHIDDAQLAWTQLRNTSVCYSRSGVYVNGAKALACYGWVKYTQILLCLLGFLCEIRSALSYKTPFGQSGHLDVMVKTLYRLGNSRISVMRICHFWQF